MSIVYEELFKGFDITEGTLTTETLEDVIADIDVMYPNDVSDEIKVRWINAELQSVYKDAFINFIHRVTTVADSGLYDLADNIQVKNILSPVYMSDTTTISEDSSFTVYEYVRSHNDLIGNCYYDAKFNKKNQLGIYPKPTKNNLIITFAYKRKPSAVTAADQTVRPEIRDEWTDLLKYKCIMKLALSGNNPDVEVYNAYGRLYNALVAEVKKDRYEQEREYKRTRDVLHKHTPDDLALSVLRTLSRM